MVLPTAPDMVLVLDNFIGIDVGGSPVVPALSRNCGPSSRRTSQELPVDARHETPSRQR
ncbi:MAG: hypothetical protein QOG04_2163 [Actinomycetota bacterium]|nr:hypothetical protein [Actinomycetota bacterium]